MEDNTSVIEVEVGSYINISLLAFRHACITASCTVTSDISFLTPFTEYLDVYLLISWLHTSSMHSYKKVEVKFILEQATKAQRGNRGIVLLFL
jgi:hypothetical protein